MPQLSLGSGLLERCWLDQADGIEPHRIHQFKRTFSGISPCSARSCAIVLEYGNSGRYPTPDLSSPLKMNSGISGLTGTGSLPIRDANDTTACTVASLVDPRHPASSFVAKTGLKKCMLQTQPTSPLASETIDVPNVGELVPDWHWPQPQHPGLRRLIA
ncbi:hypothetical protein QQS42_14675 [Glutamicibacter nicotianae]|nr:hypothetical protein [Glutamicibacter nicotianae]WIV43540.1 hypothetical protein QQS42_14675 [Glutamicibacter nicotianae]